MDRTGKTRIPKNRTAFLLFFERKGNKTNSTTEIVVKGKKGTQSLSVLDRIVHNGSISLRSTLKADL